MRNGQICFFCPFLLVCCLLNFYFLKTTGVILDPKIFYYIAEGLGAIGVVLILVSYWMLQNNRFPRDLLGYSVMNLVGAILVIISLCYSWNTSAMVIEVAWVIMSFMAILKALNERAKNKRNPPIVPPPGV